MRTLISIAVLSLFVFGLVNAGEAPAPKKKGKHGCILHMDGMKDAKYEVTNIPDGVTLKITSDKPEVVKKIQESMAQCRVAHESGDHKKCPMKKAADTCHHEHHEQ